MNSGLPMVSIMMNCYNGEKYLREAIDSVFAQTYDAWEIVFWDNQSTDGSSDIVKSYDSEKIKYIYAPEHTSLYKARNLALEFCTCEYVAFLDCDDLWEPQKLEKQIAVFEGDNNIVLVHSNTVFFNSDNGYSRVANIEVMPSGSIFKSLVEKYRVSLETVVVRRDTLVKHCLNFGDSYNMIGDRDLFTLLSYY